MAIKKSELYSSIWKSCDELRGGMDASQYKDYVLILLFMKYVSDKYSNQKDALIEIPEGGSFADMVALKGDKEIGDKINKIISKLAEANGLRGVIDVADFNEEEKLGRGKEMVDRLSNLVAIFDTPELDFRGNRADGDDLLGDAYEYLMRHFATESGKSKGQFYTPAEVSRIMAQVIEVGTAISGDQTIYDPTCGSGSLLLKAHDEAKSLTGLDLAIYGQEIDNATAALAKMNMILHDCPTAEIWKDNTLSSPYFKTDDGRLKTHDFVVANPPFSSKAWSNGLNPANDLYSRFEYGIPPAKNGDYAFLLHILSSLKSTGKGAVILPLGVLFRGNAEANIRKRIIRYIKGIIGLPSNLFYGTGIPACIIVLDKEYAHVRHGVFMVDASRGFMKDGNKNRLRAQDIHKIVDTFNRQLEIDKYSRMVPLTEIEANDYNLNIPRYIDSTEPDDLQDIEAHLKGGIPNRDIDNLEHYWNILPNSKNILFVPIERPDYSQLQVKDNEIKDTILGNAEFTAFNKMVCTLFETWKQNNISLLKGIQKGDSPKRLITLLSESLLETLRPAPLISAYNGYQSLMDYWADIMQDDVYSIVSYGWETGRAIKVIEKRGKVPEIKADLLPPNLLISRYFMIENDEINNLLVEQENILQRMKELVEETGGQESPLEALRGSKGITKGAVQERVLQIKKEILDSTSVTAEEKKAAKTIKKDFGKVDWRRGIEDEAELFPELDILYDYLLLFEAEAKFKESIKVKQKDLFNKVVTKYAELTEVEIKAFVVEDKWLHRLEADVQNELERVSQTLTGRIIELSERYITPLPKMVNEVTDLSNRVNTHLQRMGYSWS